MKMKRILSVLLLLTLGCAVFLCGCSGGENTENTQASAQNPASSSSKTKTDSQKVLDKYCKSFVKGNNPLYGTWLIEGFDVPFFIFRNDNLGEMVMGGEGSFASLKLDSENKKLAATFIVGINGEYDYSLSEDNKTLTLTGEGETLTMIRQEDYNFIPKAPEKPLTDSNILGWWKSSDGMVYYFGGDGIMYSNQISMETFYTYEAGDGKIKAVYDYGDDVTVELSYRRKGKKLNIDGSSFSPYNPFEK